MKHFIYKQDVSPVKASRIISFGECFFLPRRSVWRNIQQWKGLVPRRLFRMNKEGREERTTSQYDALYLQIGRFANKSLQHH